MSSCKDESDRSWRELVDPEPEGKDVGVYCYRCGTRNRRDAGWRYKTRHMLQRQPEDTIALLRALRLPITRYLYECPMCRRDLYAVADVAYMSE